MLVWCHCNFVTTETYVPASIADIHVLYIWVPITRNFIKDRNKRFFFFPRHIAGLKFNFILFYFFKVVSE